MTLLFTEIEGSTALLRRLGEDAHASVFADHDAFIRAKFETGLRMSREQFDQGFAHGRTLSFDDAIAPALGLETARR
jgi:hypothetical protein